MSKKKDKKDKKKQRKGGKVLAAGAQAAAAPLMGSAQQEAPPPIEGPARAMVIMAHPDDAEFLCSGTVAKWCKEGWEVVRQRGSHVRLKKAGRRHALVVPLPENSVAAPSPASSAMPTSAPTTCGACSTSPRSAPAEGRGARCPRCGEGTCVGET